jgi:Ca-activated chloride channel family protein
MNRIAAIISFLVICLVTFLFSPLLASSNVLFILDASGSMWGQIEGVPKITIAKKAMTALLKDLPKDTKIGLMTYGHRSEGDCKDVELLAAIGAHDPKQLAARLAPIMPKGKTPLAYSLEQSLPYFSSFKGQNNFVVLVSDGIETCEGDPAKAAGKLAAANIGVKVHVVGFDVKGTERQQLESIAQAGNGFYFNAQNAQGLKNALTQVQMVVTEPPRTETPPKLPQTTFKEYFVDNFEGTKLKEHWEVLNPNPDRFIVEQGNLLVIASQPGDLRKDMVENFFRLDKPLPPGDWVLTAKVKVDFQTQQEKVFLGLYENNQEFLLVQNEPLYGWDWRRPEKLTVELLKNARGQTNKFSSVIFKDFKPGPYKESANSLPQPLLLRLRKEGRTFFGEARLEGVANPQWMEIGKFTILAPKGKPVFGFYQSEKVPGESTANFDWVKIETVE